MCFLKFNDSSTYYQILWNWVLYYVFDFSSFLAEPPVVKTKHPVQFFLDGVCLSESGMQYIKSLAPDQPKKIPRPRKMKQNLSGLSPFSLHNIDRNEDSTSAMAPGSVSLWVLSYKSPLSFLSFSHWHWNQLQKLFVLIRSCFLCFSVVLFISSLVNKIFKQVVCFFDNCWSFCGPLNLFFTVTVLMKRAHWIMNVHLIVDIVPVRN